MTLRGVAGESSVQSIQRALVSVPGVEACRPIESTRKGDTISFRVESKSGGESTFHALLEALKKASPGGPTAANRMPVYRLDDWFWISTDSLCMKGI